MNFYYIKNTKIFVVECILLGPYQTPAIDAARQNLAATFVNGFVNCGFGTDTILEKDEKSAADWYHKNKEYCEFFN
jgi:hypothetical protein